jgi:FolB domain-containing protein
MSTSTLHSTSFDSVIIRDLRCHATIGNDRWGKAAPQPIRVTVHLETALARTGHSDNIHEAINYSDLFRELMSLVNGGVFDNLRALAETVVQYALNKLGVRAVKVDAEALNQFLLADALVVTLYRDNGQGTSPLEDRICIRDLRLNAIIGTSQPERECRQPVITSLTFNDPSWVRPNWHEMQNAIVKVRNLRCCTSLRHCCPDVRLIFPTRYVA